MAKLLTYSEKTKQTSNVRPPLFRKINYILMIVGVILLAIGYILLSGGAAESPDVFTGEIFNVRRLRVAPIFMVIGLVIEIFAIMYHPKTKSENPKEA